MFLLLAVLVSIPARASATESTFIVLDQRTQDDPDAERLVHRLQGELAADGVHVAIDAGGSGAIEPAVLARRAAAVSAAVGAAFLVETGGRGIELTLVFASTGRALRRRMDGDAPGESPEVIARRSVDLLRASLADFLLGSVRVPPAPPEARAPRTPGRAGGTASPSVRVNLEGGAGVLTSFDGVGSAVVPVLRVGVEAGAWWRLRATLAALGTRPTVVSSAGSASVEQGVGLVELFVSPWKSHPVRPTASLGLGVYYVRVDGSGIAPYAGTQTSSAAFAVSAGVGLNIAIASSLDLAFDVVTLVTAPGLAVRFVDDDSARLGRPSLLATGTLSGWL